jgi:L-idonate 5-dehydrogenase
VREHLLHGLGVEDAAHAGRFRQFLRRVPEQCVKIRPSAVPAAALAERLAVCLHAVAAGDISGKRAVVFSAGPIGSHHAGGAARRHCLKSLSSILPLHRRLCQPARRRPCRRCSGGDEGLKAHAATAFDVASKPRERRQARQPSALSGAVASVVQIGQSPRGQIAVPANAVMAKEIDLRGSFRFGSEFMTAVELISDGSVDVMALVTAERPLAGAPDAMRLALDRSQSVKVVLTAH